MNQTWLQFEPLALSSEESASGVVPKPKWKRLVEMAKKEEGQRKFKRGEKSTTGLYFWAKGMWVTQKVYEHRKKNHFISYKKRNHTPMAIRKKEVDEFHRSLISKGYKAGDFCKETGKIVISVSLLRNRIKFLSETKFAENKLKKRENQIRYTKSGITRLRSQKRYKNPMERMKNICRKRVYNIIKYKGWSKKCKTLDMIGCDWSSFKNHLESKFRDGINWHNMGAYGWHIDHIIPLSSAKNEEEVQKLCHFTNIQPLWWHENLSKGCRVAINFSHPAKFPIATP